MGLVLSERSTNQRLGRKRSRANIISRKLADIEGGISEANGGNAKRKEIGPES